MHPFGRGKAPAKIIVMGRKGPKKSEGELPLADFILLIFLRFLTLVQSYDKILFNLMMQGIKLKVFESGTRRT